MRIKKPYHNPDQPRYDGRTMADPISDLGGRILHPFEAYWHQAGRWPVEIVNPAPVL